MKNLVVENKTRTITCRIDHSLSPVPHFHRHIELVYVIDGESYANADRKNYKLNKGDMFFAFPNQIHYYNTVVNGEYLLIIFTPDILYGLNDIMVLMIYFLIIFQTQMSFPLKTVLTFSTSLLKYPKKD